MYYLVTIVLKELNDDGKLKKTTMKYVVNAISPTDVEAKVVKDFIGDTTDYSIKSITESNIVKIIE